MLNLESTPLLISYLTCTLPEPPSIFGGRMSNRENVMTRGSRILRDWLDREESPSQAGFAVEVGVTQSAVSNMVRGYQRPSLATACLIQARTSGAVVVTDWLDDDEASKHSSLERAAG